jgi:hypothetical protein
MLVIPKQMEVDSDVSTATPCSKRRTRRTTEVFCDDDGRFNFKNWHKYFESVNVEGKNVSFIPCESKPTLCCL